MKLRKTDKQEYEVIDEDGQVRGHLLREHHRSVGDPRYVGYIPAHHTWDFVLIEEYGPRPGTSFKSFIGAKHYLADLIACDSRSTEPAADEPREGEAGDDDGAEDGDLDSMIQMWER